MIMTKQKILNSLFEYFLEVPTELKKEYGKALNTIKQILNESEPRELTATIRGDELVATLKSAGRRPQPYSNAVKAEIARLDRKIDANADIAWERVVELERFISNTDKQILDAFTGRPLPYCPPTVQEMDGVRMETEKQYKAKGFNPGR